MKHKEKYFLFLGTQVKNKPVEVISYSVYRLDGTHLRVVVVKEYIFKAQRRKLWEKNRAAKNQTTQPNDLT